MLLAGLKYNIFNQNRLSLCILKKTLLRRLTQICFLHKFSLVSIVFIVEEKILKKKLKSD